MNEFRQTPIVRLNKGGYEAIDAKLAHKYMCEWATKQNIAIRSKVIVSIMFKTMLVDRVIKHPVTGTMLNLRNGYKYSISANTCEVREEKNITRHKDETYYGIPGIVVEVVTIRNIASIEDEENKMKASLVDWRKNNFVFEKTHGFVDYQKTDARNVIRVTDGKILSEPEFYKCPLDYVIQFICAIDQLHAAYRTDQYGIIWEIQRDEYNAIRIRGTHSVTSAPVIFEDDQYVKEEGERRIRESDEAYEVQKKIKLMSREYQNIINSVNSDTSDKQIAYDKIVRDIEIDAISNEDKSEDGIDLKTISTGLDIASKVKRLL